MYSADSLIATVHDRSNCSLQFTGQGKWGVRKQHIKLINQDLDSLRLTWSLEGKEPEMGNAYG